MAFLSEYAITPDFLERVCITETFCATIPENHRFIWKQFRKKFRENIFEGALVRNLHDGEWASYCLNSRELPEYGVRLVKELVKKNRLRSSRAFQDKKPLSDLEWGKEALASDITRPLLGILSTDAVISKLPANEKLLNIDQLPELNRWNDFTYNDPMEIKRTIQSYIEHLDNILAIPTKYVFIDPYLDPTREGGGYSNFIKLVLAIRERQPEIPKEDLLIEIHRKSSWRDKQGIRIEPSRDEWKEKFKEWNKPLREANLGIKILVWNYIHKRMLLTKHIGLHLGNGFDENFNEREADTWERLTRQQLEYYTSYYKENSNSKRLKLIHKPIVLPYD